MRAAIDGAGADRLTAPALEPLKIAVRHRGYHLIAAGKGAPSMLRACLDALGPPSGGVVATVGSATGLPDRLRVFAATHPEPGEESVNAGRAAIALARSASDTPLVVLISGGASAMLALPRAPLNPADKVAATRVLLRSGVAIDELNCVRKHLSGIKGGQLAAAAWPRPVHAFALSDVVSPREDDPSVIGSGPTVADATTWSDALAIVERAGAQAMPVAVTAMLREGAAGRVPDTPKPGDERLARASFTLVGGRRDALRAAEREARRLGYRCLTIDQPLTGEAREAGPRLLRQALALATGIEAPCCVLSGGETTVTVRGDGRGGRNQELALSIVDRLERENRVVVVASVGTDGIDGPTPAAGAIVDSTTRTRAAAKGLSAGASLARNDAYPFFQSLGDLVETGPTGTNVGDVQVTLIGPMTR